MYDPAIFPRQTQQCITCPAPQPCSCGPNQECVQIARDCNTCAVTQCVARGVNPTIKSSGGVSKGALAGAIIGSIGFLSLALAFFIRHRRKSLIRRNSTPAREVKDIPASAETVLNRPDPTEKLASELEAAKAVPAFPTTINALSDSQDYNPALLPPHINPFDDTHSIQTTRTEGTNVIPIALVPPAESRRASSSHSEALTSSSGGSQGPVRPLRSPDLNLNLDHVNVSSDNLRPGAYSMRSGISGVSSRHSYMSNASYSSDFLNEAPTIVTPGKGAVRQVFGVVKAEVISAGSLGSPDGLKPGFSKPAVKSPLAATSFGPNDFIREDSSESHEGNDPFSDENSHKANHSPDASPATSTFQPTPAQPPHSDTDETRWSSLGPKAPWAKPDDSSRPSSMATQAGSVIDIASATRVNVGLKTPGSANSYRTTMARLISPSGEPGTLQEQQRRALAHAQAQAQAQGLEKRRISGSSVLSATSTRADSILESFPFVPPSPISDRPVRSPPVSPLGQQSFTNVVVAPPSPLTPRSFAAAGAGKTSPDANSGALPTPDRRFLGLSTGSQLSTASSGLGSFPFQIDTDPTPDSLPSGTPFHVRQRASLDTLAITSDLSSFPLNFDRDSHLPPPPKK